MTKFFNLDVFADNSTILLIGMALFFIIFFIFMIFYLRINKRILEEIKKDNHETRQKAYCDAVKALGDRLAEYSQTTLLTAVNDRYEGLVSQELLPAVNDAVHKVSGLADAVASHQKEGLLLIAEDLAGLFSGCLDKYVKNQTDAITFLDSATASFSQELSRITATLNTLSALHANVLEKAETTADALYNANHRIEGKALELNAILDSSANLAADINSLTAANTDLAEKLSQSMLMAKQGTEDAVNLVDAQSYKTAELLSSAVNEMRQNSENAARDLLDNILVNFKDSSEALADSLLALTDITGAVERSASGFSEGLSSVYKDFNEILNQNLHQIGAAISASLNEEHQKITASASGISSAFQEGLNIVRNELQIHIQQLSSITGELSHNVSQFGGDIGAFADRFEYGMDQSISTALGQMDASLAEIVSRLVNVTINIQQAADSLPAALNALIKEE